MSPLMGAASDAQSLVDVCVCLAEADGLYPDGCGFTDWQKLRVFSSVRSPTVAGSTPPRSRNQGQGLLTIEMASCLVIGIKEGRRWKGGPAVTGRWMYEWRRGGQS